MRNFCELLLLASSLQPQFTLSQVASKGAEPFEPGNSSLQGPRGNWVRTERTRVDAVRLSLAAVAFEIHVAITAANLPRLLANAGLTQVARA